jgi:hypothetical protein
MGQCAAAFADPTSRPRQAGIDYYLLPIRQASAFHPKIGLLLGRTSGVAFVGSHNLTMQGFGVNAELTNVVEYRRGKDVSPIFRDILDFLSTWAGDVARTLPESISDMGYRVLPALPDQSKKDQDFTFYGSGFRGPSLWTKVRTLLPQKVDKIKVLGPFFDDQLAFLKMLQSTFQPKEFVVCIEPDTVQISPKAKMMLPHAQFRDCSEIRGSRGYLHAKMILLETKQQEVLITGSANPSRPA